MGLNIGVNALTSGGLSIAVVLLVVTGILLVSASQKVSQMDEFGSSSQLQKAFNNLRTAYWLMFIAAVITLVLAIAYGGHETAWCPSEWIHGIIYVLLVAAVIIGVIYAYVALNDLYDPDFHNLNGASSFIWAALIIGTLTFILVISTASGRVGYNVARGSATHRIRHAERKLHEMHSHVTGKPNDYVEPVDHCCEPEQPACPMKVPAGMMLVHANPVVQQSVVPQVTVRTQPLNQSTVLPAVPRPAYQSQTVVSPMNQQQFMGSPTVTSHSVVTTSQPVVTSTTYPQQSYSAMNSLANASLSRVPDYL